MKVVRLPAASLENYEVAAQKIRDGGVVAYPTETSYGLAVDPFSERALQRLFIIKKRLQNKSFSVLIANEQQLSLLVETIPQQYRLLMNRFWPGPLTLVFQAKKKLPQSLLADDATVGIRISSHPVALKLVEAAAMPITATSANISGESAAVSSEEVLTQFGDSIDMILIDDSGLQGQYSTVVKMEGGQLKLVRAGVIPFEEILKVAGQQ